MNLELLRLLCYIYMDLVQHRASKSVSEKNQSAIDGKLFSSYIARGQCWVFQIPKQVTWTARMRYLSRKKYWLYAICHDKVFASFLCIASMILIMVYIKQQANKIVSSKGLCNEQTNMVLLLRFVHQNWLTGAGLCKKSNTFLRSVGLDILDCLGEGYNGTGAAAGKNEWLLVQVCRINSKVLYTKCKPLTESCCYTFMPGTMGKERKKSNLAEKVNLHAPNARFQKLVWCVLYKVDRERADGMSSWLCQFVIVSMWATF